MLTGVLIEKLDIFAKTFYLIMIGIKKFRDKVRNENLYGLTSATQRDDPKATLSSVPQKIHENFQVSIKQAIKSLKLKYIYKNIVIYLLKNISCDFYNLIYHKTYLYFPYLRSNKSKVQL